MAVAALGIAQAQQPQRGGERRGTQGEAREFSPEQMARLRTDRLVKMLDLSDSQKEQVYKLNLQSIAQQQAARQNMDKNMENARSQAEAARKEYDSRLREILTPEQVQKMEASRPQQGSQYSRQQGPPQRQSAADDKKDNAQSKEKGKDKKDNAQSNKKGKDKKDTTRK